MLSLDEQILRLQIKERLLREKNSILPLSPDETVRFLSDVESIKNSLLVIRQQLDVVISQNHLRDLKNTDGLF